MFCKWLKVQLLTQKVALPDSMYEDLIHAVEWIGRRWDWVDPKNESTAAIALVNAALESRTQYWKDRGFNTEDKIRRAHLRASAQWLRMPKLSSKRRAASKCTSARPIRRPRSASPRMGASPRRARAATPTPSKPDTFSKSNARNRRFHPRGHHPGPQVPEEGSGGGCASADRRENERVGR